MSEKPKVKEEKSLEDKAVVYLTSQVDTIIAIKVKEERNRIIGLIDEMIKETGQPNGARNNGKVAYIILKELKSRIEGGIK